MKRKTEMLSDAVLNHAAAWLHRVEAAPDDPALQRAVEDWIAEDEAHGRAWALARKAWTLAGDATPAFADVWEKPVVPSGDRRAAPPRTGRRLAAGIAAAMAACLLLLFASPQFMTWFRADHATATADVREIVLEDGSVVYLSADSAIATKFADRARSVALLRGEAFFQVVPDPTRPFTVKADGFTVTVTGTAFDVGLTAGTFSVAVASGAVRVAHRGSAGTPESALSPGQRLLVDRKTGAVALSTIVPSDVAAWRTGQLVVENAAVSDVIEAIARFHRGAILVVSPSLEQRRVTGVYDLRDPARALRVLAGPYGGVVRGVTPYLLTVSDF